MAAEHQVRNLTTGDVNTVRVRRKVVDATYLESSIPATHRPSFSVASEASFEPLNALPDVADAYQQFTVIGAGKTSVDACLWLLDNGVDPDRIRWVRPRDMWFNDRAHLQPLDQVAQTMEGISRDAEAAAEASDLTDRFERLEASGRLVRIDPGVWPTMFRATMLSQPELEDVRQIEDVVRLGRVRSIEADRLVLDDGEVSTGSDVLHVDCSAIGLRASKAVPIFGDDRIVLQQVRYGSPPFNAALLGFIESRRCVRRGQEPAEPAQPAPEQHRGLGSDDAHHLAGPAGLVEGSSRGLVDRVEPSESHACTPRAPRRTAHAGASPLPDERRPAIERCRGVASQPCHRYRAI